MDPILTQLRHLVPLLQNRDDQLFSYKDIVSSELDPAPDELLSSAFKKVGVVLQQNYSILLLKKLLLTKFELLCTSLELIEDVVYSYGELRSVLLTVEGFNERCWDHSAHSGLTIELAHLMDFYISSHSKWLSSLLFKTISSEKLLEVVKFESSFSRTLLCLTATFTSLFNGDGQTRVKKREYVSEELLSMHSSEENVSWSDYLVPGAQSGTLRLVCRDVFSRLWKEVAERVVMRTELVISDGRVVEELVPWLTKVSQLDDLNAFPVVIDCLRHILATYHQRRGMAEWDKAFQTSLVTTLMQYRKGYRLPSDHGPESAKEFACLGPCNVLDSSLMEQAKDVTKVSTDSHKSIASHVNALRHSLLLSAALNATVDHMAFVLVQNMASNINAWNLDSLAWLLFMEVPFTRKVLESSACVMYKAASPRVAFPPYSCGLHSLERACRKSCASLHDTSMHLKETMEGFYEGFQTDWAAKCSDLLKSSFPPPRHWKSIKKQGHIDHSVYCDYVVSDLILPVVEAAVTLPSPEQKNFVFLMTAVFFSEYRKTITSHRKIFNFFGGRQLLTDFRTILRWLTSSDLHLKKDTLRLLSRAPLLTEMERGLLTLCGLPGDDEEVDQEALMRDLNISLPSHNFPVLLELAWNTPEDWNACQH